MNDLPVLIKRCLALGVKILPFAINDILHQYEVKKIPDDVLCKLPKEMLETYVEALYLSAQEGACDWTKGHALLEEEFGFKRVKRKEGYMVFVSMVYPDTNTGTDKE
jgi:hypothetical protein